MILLSFSMNSTSNKLRLKARKEVMSSPKIKAMALCRVSSDEQLKNHSLARQNEAVYKTAEKLKVEIPPEYIWSGSVSSKTGTNVHRKDLQEMVQACKKDKKIKYLIIDEPDRFMRSIDEAFHFEVEFKKYGVRVWYTDNELNSDTTMAKFMRFMKYFQAESSNNERMHKTIAGQTSAINAGRYPYQPLRGYKKGIISGVPEKDGRKADIMQDVLKRLAAGMLNLTESLKEYNRLAATIYAIPKEVKMDKWKKLVVNPFYAGIIVMDKNVKARNEHGLHEPLITKDEHRRICELVEESKKHKVHNGANKQGNPEFPLNGLLRHADCPRTHSKYDKFVGLNQHAKTRVYPKYRCRGCYCSINRDELNHKVIEVCNSIDMTERGRKLFLSALQEIWIRQEDNAMQRKQSLTAALIDAKKTVDKHTRAYIDETDPDIKNSIKEVLNKSRDQADRLEKMLNEVGETANLEREEFTRFALEFIDNLGTHLISLSPDNAKKCKQILFPDGFWTVDAKNVYTRQISPIYRYRNKKFSANCAENPLWCEWRESNSHPKFGKLVY